MWSQIFVRFALSLAVSEISTFFNFSIVFQFLVLKFKNIKKIETFQILVILPIIMHVILIFCPFCSISYCFEIRKCILNNRLFGYWSNNWLLNGQFWSNQKFAHGRSVNIPEDVPWQILERFVEKWILYAPEEISIQTSDFWRITRPIAYDSLQPSV